MSPPEDVIPGGGGLTLRDAFAVQAMQAALADALRGYGHICPTVTERAAKLSYEVADAAVAYGRASPPPIQGEGG